MKVLTKALEIVKSDIPVEASPGQIKAYLKEQGIKVDYNEARRLHRQNLKKNAPIVEAKVNAPSSSARHSASHGSTH